MKTPVAPPRSEERYGNCRVRGKPAARAPARRLPAAAWKSQ